MCHYSKYHHLAAGPCPAHNKSLHWMAITLRSIATGELGVPGGCAAWNRGADFVQHRDYALKESNIHV